MTDDPHTASVEVSKESPPVVQTDHPDTPAPDSETAPKKRRGAPPGNQNALKTGLRSGKFPPGTEYLTKEISNFKRLAVPAILDARGLASLGFAEVALLQTAIEHYAHGLRVRRWLRVGWDDLTPDQVLAYSREIGRAFDARDKVLKQLGVTEHAEDGSRRTLYTIPELPDDPEEGQTNAPTTPPAV